MSTLGSVPPCRPLPEWEKHKAVIYKLYIEQKKPLKVVREVMESEYGFIATYWVFCYMLCVTCCLRIHWTDICSRMNQYKKIIGMWNMSKNIPTETMTAISNIIARRSAVQKDTVFRLRNNLVPAKKIERFLARNKISSVLDHFEDICTSMELEFKKLPALANLWLDGLDTQTLDGLIFHTPGKVNWVLQLSASNAYLISPVLRTPEAVADDGTIFDLSNVLSTSPDEGYYCTPTPGEAPQNDVFPREELTMPPCTKWNLQGRPCGGACSGDCTYDAFISLEEERTFQPSTRPSRWKESGIGESMILPDVAESAPFTDSGYASVPLVTNNAKIDGLTRPVQPDKRDTSTLGPGDASRTIYSESTVDGQLAGRYIRELAEDIHRRLGLNNRREEWRTQSLNATTLLKAFAIKIAHHSNSPTHRNIIRFVHKHCQFISSFNCRII